MAKNWRLQGQVLVTCNCDWGCPCNVNGRPTTGKCEGGWTWHIESGSYGTTVLDELNFSIFADWPGAIHEGGGQWGLFANTYQLEGPDPVPYQVDVANGHSYYRVGDVAELRVEPITNPVTGDEIHPRLLLPEGLL